MIGGRSAWLLGLAGSAVNLTLVDPSAWAAGFGGFAIWGFPVYLAALNAGILALIACGRLAGRITIGRPGMAW